MIGMFSGIITAMGTVRALSYSNADATTSTGAHTHIDSDADRAQMRIVIEVPRNIMRRLRQGASVAVQGICLTVTKLNRRKRLFTADVLLTTRACTTIECWTVGHWVNIELALAVGATLDGHIVQGHVSGTGTLMRIDVQHAQHLLSFCTDDEQCRAIVKKGSIAIDGISLTIADCAENTFEVGVTPYTYTHTSIQHLTCGTKVNLETDVFLRYMISQQDRYAVVEKK